MWDMTHSYLWHDSFTRVTWLIHTCDMTHSHVWHDSFTRVTWLIHMRDIEVLWHGSHVWMCHNTYEAHIWNTNACHVCQVKWMSHCVKSKWMSHCVMTGISVATYVCFIYETVVSWHAWVSQHSFIRVAHECDKTHSYVSHMSVTTFIHTRVCHNTHLYMCRVITLIHMNVSIITPIHVSIVTLS